MEVRFGFTSRGRPNDSMNLRRHEIDEKRKEKDDNSKKKKKYSRVVKGHHPHTCARITCPMSFLSTSEGKVSSTSTLGPLLSGPNAQMLRAVSKSQSYLA